MATVHMSEAEVARDLRAAPAKVQQGIEIVIEQAYEGKLGYAPILDEDFAKDVQSGLDARRDSFEPPAWD